MCVVPFSDFGSWITFGPLRIRRLFYIWTTLLITVHTRPAQHTARGPHEARESFSCGPLELSQLQKMLRKLDLE